MPGIIVIGAQWGDEGKGKAVDVFSAQSDYVIRYQGGANAGHTLKINGQTKVLHLIPSGIFHSNTTCLIAAGVVLDIESLCDEIRALKASGYLQNSSQLLVSDSVTVLLKYHRLLDQAREGHANGVKIGTTGKGIGPAYEDRASRKALLFADLFSSPEQLKQKLTRAIEEKRFLIEKFYNLKVPSVEELLEGILKLRDELRPHRCQDISRIIYRALKDNKKVLFEGAQGCLLDLLHGTYPYVTSSNTVAGAALTGSGIGLGSIHKIIAIAKSYTTRVGAGPFPTECHGDLGERLQQAGGEWGATTGRKRRCGWLDLPALKYAIRINGITHLALMKLDVLSGLKEIPVCTSYRLNGKTLGTDEFPVASEELHKCEPVYKTLPGWMEDISKIRSFTDLPQKARDYVQLIQKELSLPVDIISVGPSREETLWLKTLFEK